MGLGCQHTQICSLTMLHVSHPYLVSLSFYTIPIVQDFYFTCLHHFYILLRVISVKGGNPRIKSNNIIEKMHVVVMEMMYNMHVYQVSSPCVLQLASLRSEFFKENYLWLFVVVVVMETM